MILDTLLLFVLTFLAGLAVFFVPKMNNKIFKLALVFSGSYLFSITIIHILPELFQHGLEVKYIAFYVLLGFFLQVILEYFTEGVEHGHLHGQQHAQHSHQWFSLMLALCIHSFLEGTLLAHPTTIHAEHAQANSVFIGILLHKLPAAFALMTVILCHFKSKRKIILLLLIFSLASPLGLITSNVLFKESMLSEEIFLIFFALVSGNFLHISTTIFFESSPDHSLGIRKLMVAVVAALIAVGTELLL